MFNMDKGSQILTTIDKQILTDLLNAYERKTSGSNRRTIIKAEKFKAYDLNDVDKKNLFIQSAKSLSDKGMIQFEWKKYEKNNLLERLILLEDRIELAYGALGRPTKEQRTESFINELEKYRTEIDSEWIMRFFKDEEANIRNKSTWSGIWPKTCRARKEFVALLKSVDEQQDKSMRYLSIRLFGDSKKLEKQYKAKLVSVARKYKSLSLEDDEILEYLGIMLNPVEILIYGPLDYTLMGKRIHTSDYMFGTSINKSTVEHMCEISVEADRVLTIENKATYYEYIKTCPENVFVIYLGGFFGSTANKFLTSLSLLENLSFFHWSDIDLGGFRIYKYLFSVLKSNLRPVGMDRQTYVKYLERYTNTEKITERQLIEIEELTRSCEMECLNMTMKEAIKHKRRIEQECIEIPDFENIFKDVSADSRNDCESI